MPRPVAILLLAGLACGLAAGAVSGPASTAAGQVGTGAGPEPSIRIVDQTTFVPADGVFQLVLDVTRWPGTAPATGGRDGPADQPSLSVTFFGRLETEAGIAQPPDQALNRMPAIPLATAPRNEAGWVHLAIPIRSSASFDDQARVLLPAPGVYPVTVELRDADGVLAAVRTHLVRQPIETADEPTRAPVEVALVLNVTTSEGLTVADTTSLLTAHPTVPLTVILDQGVITQLRADPEATRALAAALGERPVLAVPTIDLDPSAMAEIGQTDLYLAAARADRQAVVELGLRPAAGIALLSSPVTGDGIRVLDRLGVHSVLDTDDRLVGSGVIADDPPIQVIRTDRDLNDVLGGDDEGPVPEAGPLRANRALARLTLRQQLDDGPLVIGGPDLGVDPLPAIDAFLRSLSQPGAPQPVPLSAVTGGPSLRVAERPQQDLAPVVDLVDAIRRTLDAYESSHVAGGTEPDDYLQRLAGALTLRRNPEDRLRALTLLLGQLDDELGVIRIHRPQPVTLAARSAPIPLVIENTAPDPRRVVLRFRGDRVVSAADGRELLVQPGTSSIDVEVEARSLGVSPLEVSVWSGDESVLLSEARFQIRSTAIPGLGLLISLSAVAMLGTWWVLDHRKRRRQGPGVDPDARGPRGTGPGPGPGAGELQRGRGGETAQPRPTTV
jgi:hypothetical protein